MVEPVVAQLVLRAVREMVVAAVHKVRVERVAVQPVQMEPRALHIWAVEVTTKVVVVVAATSVVVVAETTPVVVVVQVMLRY